jgi:hypothetical protein
MVGNLASVSADDAVQRAGGFRSILGILKHTAGWSRVYHSFAFEPKPTHWRGIEWPRGLRDTVDTTQDYFAEILAWFDSSFTSWRTSVAGLDDDEFDGPRPCHWGTSAPLFDVLLMVTNHWCYHAGEINQILSVVRAEAWEYSEEVEENLISTAGHRIRPGWMSDEHAVRYEAYLAMRDTELHGPTPAPP